MQKILLIQLIKLAKNRSTIWWPQLPNWIRTVCKCCPKVIEARQLHRKCTARRTWPLPMMVCVHCTEKHKKHNWFSSHFLQQTRIAKKTIQMKIGVRFVWMAVSSCVVISARRCSIRIVIFPISVRYRTKVKLGNVCCASIWPNCHWVRIHLFLFCIYVQ